MKRLFLFAVALVCCVASFAVSYVQLCGYMLNTDGEGEDIADLASVLNAMDGVSATGTISWNVATKTLTMENATIDNSNDQIVLKFTDFARITLEVLGTNQLKSSCTSAQECINLSYGTKNSLTITGTGSLDISSYRWFPISLPGPATLTIKDASVNLFTEYYTSDTRNYGIEYNSGTGGTIVFDNANVKAGTIGEMKSITLTDCKIVAPTGAEVVKVDENIYRVKVGDKTATGIVIQKALNVGDTFTANTEEGVAVTYKILTKEAGNMTVIVGEYNNTAIDKETVGAF